MHVYVRTCTCKCMVEDRAGGCGVVEGRCVWCGCGQGCVVWLRAGVCIVVDWLSGWVWVVGVL